MVISVSERFGEGPWENFGAGRTGTGNSDDSSFDSDCCDVGGLEESASEGDGDDDEEAADLAFFGWGPLSLEDSEVGVERRLLVLLVLGIVGAERRRLRLPWRFRNLTSAGLS